MRSLFGSVALLALAGAASAQEQADTAKRALKLSGFAEASYAYSTRNVGSAIVGRLYTASTTNSS